MKKILLLIIMILGVNSMSFAQDPTFGTEEVGLPLIVPSSPEAVSIAKYGGVPINLSSGQLQFNVPIYKIVVNDFVLPIGLTYSYSGLKIEETPGRMGLGWTLNAGGVLSRQIRGIDDFNSSYGYNGQNKIGKNKVVPFIKNTLPENEKEEFITAITKNIWDSEPDKFTFKVGGESGSFYFNEELEPVFAPFKNYKIEIVDNNVNDFKIIISNDKGIKFHFTGDNDKESTIYDTEGSTLIHYLSSRFISKIEFPDSKEILFEYEPYNYTIETISESKREFIGGVDHQTNLQESCTGLQYPNTPILKTTTIAGRLLKKITFPEGEIIFDRQSTSLNSDKSVKEIRLYDYNSKQVVKYNFTYSNLESTGHFFKLDKVTKESTSSIVENYYEFEYNSGVPTFTQSLLYKQDLWGYYNDNYTGTLLPDDNYTNRKPSFSKAISGALTKIIYPTKGYTQLEYESNDVNYSSGDVLNALVVDPNRIEIGGIRIKKTLDYDDLGSTEFIETKYLYTNSDGSSSGTLSALPDYDRDYQYWLKETTGGELGMIFKCCSCLMRDKYSESTTPLTIFSGLPVLYKRVISEKVGNGQIVSYFTGEQGGQIGFPYAPPIDRSWKFGKVNRSEIFNEINELLVENKTERIINNYYDTDIIYSNNTKGRVFAIKTGLSKPGNPIYEQSDYFIETYFEYSKDSLVDYTIKNEYYNTKQLKDSTKYSYDVSNGYLKEIKSFDNNNESISKKFYYPNEVLSNSSLPGESLLQPQYDAVLQLQTNNQHRIAFPIQTETFKNDNLLSRQRTNFKSWIVNTNNTGNIVEPESIQVSKGSGALKNRLAYHRYDSYGNPLEVSKQDDTHVVYIWGYKHTKPVAKIENATYSQIEALSYFGNGFDLGNGGLSTNQENSLRTGLSNSQVTTYIYNPLIGVTSVKDPSGYISYYDYDDFNRLKYIKNKDGEVIEQYRNNYALETLTANATSNTSSASVGDTVTFSANILGGSGDFKYEWTVPGVTSLPNANQISVTTTPSHTPSFTATCKVTDNRTLESVTIYKSVTVSQSYPALSVANIISSPGSTTTSVGSSLIYSIAVSGGSNNYNYKWTKTNSQYTLTLADGSASSISDTVHSDDCSDFSVKCVVTDNITGEVITKTRTMYVIFGCSGGGFY